MNVLQSGDHGPKVVLAQLLLVTRAPHAEIAIDGHYGRAPAGAVRQFQALNPGLPQDGAIDAATWQALLTRANLATVDHVDVDDMVTAQANILQSIQQGHRFGLVAAAELARSGAAPASVSIGMSNGVTQMIAQVRSSAGGRRIGLLRIFGHGPPGGRLSQRAEASPAEPPRRDPRSRLRR
jgi:peptidoglycan hydrolase-like protein with peptidoglycan-binding domain